MRSSSSVITLQPERPSRSSKAVKNKERYNFLLMGKELISNVLRALGLVLIQSR